MEVEVIKVKVIPLDNEHRRAAASELDKNVIVLAGAGTGKTHLLIDRLMLLILGKEIPVERTVALTFTKKAGEEMRERLEERLRKIIDGTETPELLEEYFPHNKSEWPRLARRALDDIPKAQIGTIHSFAAHLLRLYPLQAGVDPNFREDEGTMFESVFEKEWIRWLKSELGHASPRAAFWRELLREVELSDLKQMARALSSPLVELGKTEEKAVSLKELVTQIETEWRKIVSEYEFPSPQKAPAFHEGVQALEAALKTALQGQRIKGDLGQALRAFKSPPKSLEQASAALKKIFRRAVALSFVDEKIITSAQTAVRPFVERFRNELKYKGVVSFDGLLVFARNLLKDHTDVRDALKKRFDAFLVDEFQDTDPVQGEILFYLGEELGGVAEVWTKANLAPGRLFVVGDPKQSIYRFRGAEIAAFQAFHQRLVKQGALEATLSDNFRSVPEILNFVNQIFPTVMKEAPMLQPPYVPLKAARATEGGGPVEIIEASKKEGTLNADEAKDVEADTVAEWIQNYASSGKKISDVAILLRSSNAFFPYLEALRRRGISYLVEGEKSFYLTSEIVDFLNLISAVADPADTLALVGVLRSPVGGLKDGEILDLKEKNELDYRMNLSTHSKKVGPIYTMLRTFHDKASTYTVPKLIHQILQESGLLELTVYSSYGEQAIANLQKIGYLAKKWEQESPLTLKAFARRLRVYRDEERKEGENPLADVSYEAVRVLTIHKAKGLEFPVVFLPNLSAGLPRGSSKPEIIRDWSTGRVGLRLTKAKRTNTAMMLLEEEVERREEAEEVRVFFVATTRAKNQMILLRSMVRDNGRFSNYLKTTESLNLPMKTIYWSKEGLKMGGSKPLVLSPTWKVESAAASLLMREKEFEKWKTELSIKTPSKMAGEAEKMRPRDEEQEERLSIANTIGLVCHKVLEEWDFSTTEKKVEAELLKNLERAARLFEIVPGTRQHDQVLGEASKILKGFMSSTEYARLSSVKIIGREIPFCYSIGDAQTDGPRLVRGVIDLLYEEEGRVVVADFKTNRLEKGGLSALIETYRPQGAAYQQAILKNLGKKADFELIFLRESRTQRL